MKSKLITSVLVVLFLATIVYAAAERVTWFKGNVRVGGNFYSQKYFTLPLTAAFLDGTGIIGNDGTTAPGIAETDNVPAIVYANSGETTKCQWQFRVPGDYTDSLSFRLLLSSSVATAAQQSIDWQIWVNRDGVAFDAAAIAQSAVSPTNDTLDGTNEVVTLTLDATGEAAITAGDYLTIDIWNAGSSNGTTEIKDIQGYYK